MKSKNILVLICVFMATALCFSTFAIDGDVQGQGTYFRVDDSEYLNITV